MSCLVLYYRNISRYLSDEQRSYKILSKKKGYQNKQLLLFPIFHCIFIHYFLEKININLLFFLQQKKIINSTNYNKNNLKKKTINLLRTIKK